MADISQAAINAAAKAIHEAGCGYIQCAQADHPDVGGADRDLAQAALEAAQPHIAAAEPHELKPDWTIAPAAVLRAWLEENPRNVLHPDAERVDTDTRDQVQEVLDRKPLTEEHAELLEWGSGVPVRFWLALEHDYRAGLAAGLKDGDSDTQPDPYIDAMAAEHVQEYEPEDA